MAWSRIERRKPLKRSGPPRKKRPGVRRGQPTDAEKEAERNRVYDVAAGDVSCVEKTACHSCQTIGRV